jgi:HAD superfamily hydrolase (TIGR01509 family)
LDFWCAFGQDKPGFDGQYVFDHTHGWRTFDAIAKYAPEFADAEFVKQLEGQVPDLYGNSAKEIPGAIKLVESLLELPTDGERLAVATSGTFDMASKWFKILGLQRPKSFITAESVKHGKPDPEPYLLGRKSLGYGDVTKKVVVFEDAPAGVTAGHGAGCLVIGIASTFDAETVKGFGADIVVPDLTGVKVIGYDQEKDVIEITIGNYIHICDELAKTLESF